MPINTSARSRIIMLQQRCVKVFKVWGGGRLTSEILQPEGYTWRKSWLQGASEVT